MSSNVDIQSIIGLVPTADRSDKSYVTPAATNTSVFDILHEMDGSSHGPVNLEDPGPDFSGKFQRSATDEEASTIAVSALLQKLSRTLSLQMDSIAVSEPLSTYGIDSLLGIELRTWIGREFEC
ncbi:hypothetical protein K491DRAFT_723217 [Lophiostoma macrostomum CBS 122681]|uniref:Carrier domain-containing protein n=1 Tax=Lophiostoma macrostomum CBS 122681 TaxID=1314788 RepID=A0A6A6SL37_9PLEO|nr:hypothetical protein K491DRAFT_723217 [Lophiostoma macrostomum CBS 122681]